jgi:hypothetical protein
MRWTAATGITTSDDRGRLRLRWLLWPVCLAGLGFAALLVERGAEPRPHASLRPLVDSAPLELGASPPPPRELPVAGHAPTPPVASAGAASADELETRRIQAYLDSIYTKRDVVSSFRTKDGDDIDCVDFYAQQSVKIEMSRGHEIRMPPATSPQSEGSAALPMNGASSPFDGRPDENGNLRKCTGMTVPVVRTTVARIKASGGLDRFLRRRPAPAVAPVQPPPGPVTPDSTGFLHVVGTYGAPLTGGYNGHTIYGGSATFSIWQPGPANSGELLAGGHSLAQEWTTSVPGTCDGEGSSGCVQTVEFGWMVAPEMCAAGECNGGRYQQCDPITGLCTPDPRPHLFIYSTQDGNNSTGMYDTAPFRPFACGGSGFNQPCSDFPGRVVPNPFIQYPGADWAPGLPIPSSTLGHPAELNLTTNSTSTFNDVPVGEWTVYVNGRNIGWWPDHTFDGGFYVAACPGCPHGPNGLPFGMFVTAGTPMETHAAFFQVGGEVAAEAGTGFNLDNGSINAVEMGNGIGGFAGGFAAYIRNAQVGYGPFFNGILNWSNGAPFSVPVYAADLNCYNYGYGVNGVPQSIPLTGLGYTVLQYPGQNPTSVMSPGPGGLGWGTYLYYGGLGWSTGFNDPKGGTNDFCCSTAAQNGVGDDTRCEQ